MSWHIAIVEGQIEFARMDRSRKRSITLTVNSCDVMVTEVGKVQDYLDCSPDKLVELLEEYEGVQTKPLTKGTEEDKQTAVNDENDNSLGQL